MKNRRRRQREDKSRGKETEYTKKSEEDSEREVKRDEQRKN